MAQDCFVIMPIGEQEPYPSGHFGRVYEHVIRPACARAGFQAVRADDINRTEDIVVDVLRRLIESPMALCDLSGRNPNVMYELGLRHAFNKPVTIIKDSTTLRVFDIQGLRDQEYDPSLRIDVIEPTINALAERLRNTYDAFGEGAKAAANSLLQLLGVTAARLPERVELSEGTQLVLGAIQDISTRLSRFERRLGSIAALTTDDQIRPRKTIASAIGDALSVSNYQVGDHVRHKLFGEGRILAVSSERGTLTIEFVNDAAGTKQIKPAYTTLERLDPGDGASKV